MQYESGRRHEHPFGCDPLGFVTVRDELSCGQSIASTADETCQSRFEFDDIRE